MIPASRIQRRPLVQSTSTEAIKRFDPSTVDGRIIAYIGAKNGATVAEMVERMGIPHQTCSAQVAHLRERGELHDSGRKDKTPSGRNAIVWQLGKSPRETLVLTSPANEVREQLTLLDVPSKRTERSAYSL